MCSAVVKFAKRLLSFQAHVDVHDEVIETDEDNNSSRVEIFDVANPAILSIIFSNLH